MEPKRNYLDYNKIKEKNNRYYGKIQITCYSGYGIKGYLCPNPLNKEQCYYDLVQSEKDNWRVEYIYLTLDEFNNQENWLK